VLLCTQPTPRTAEIAALNEFRIESGSINGADGTFSFTQRYSDGNDTIWNGRLMRLENVEDLSNDDAVSSHPRKRRLPSHAKAALVAVPHHNVLATANSRFSLLV
jgi:hypothetical protein